jgi:4,5-DOPA dioxygenase extradiol
MSTRREVLAGGVALTVALSGFGRLAGSAQTRMPALFIGHGSPMNALQRNPFTDAWRRIGAALPRPRAILSVSAHWETAEPLVLSTAQPETIDDFVGFPPELHAFRYPAPGAPEAAREAARAVRSQWVGETDRWGLDHGTWSVLAHLFPDASVPVFQLSLGRNLAAREHLVLGRELAGLRDAGVLILGSGNLVHNLPQLARDRLAGRPPLPHDWAAWFDALVTQLVEARDFDRLADLDRFGPGLRLAHPTLEHYLPLLYTLGAGGRDAEVRFFAEGFAGGSLSMRSVLMT